MADAQPEKVRVNLPDMRVLNQDGRLLVEAETFHVCTGRDEKPKRIPEELMERLKPLVTKNSPE